MQFVITSPRDFFAVAIKSTVKQISEGPRIAHLSYALDAFVIFNTFSTHSCHCRITGTSFLYTQNLPRIFESRFNHGNEVIAITLAFWVKQLKCCKQKRREWLVKSKIVRKFHHRGIVGTAISLLGAQYHLSINERCHNLINTIIKTLFLLVCLSGIGYELAHACHGISTLHNFGKHHGVCDA